MTVMTEKVQTGEDSFARLMWKNVHISKYLAFSIDDVSFLEHAKRLTKSLISKVAF